MFEAYTILSEHEIAELEAKNEEFEIFFTKEAFIEKYGIYEVMNTIFYEEFHEITEN
jgi:hypothetical protein